MSQLPLLAAFIASAIVLAGCSPESQQSAQADHEQWVNVADGRVSVQNKIPPYQGGTAIDLWTPPTPETHDSNAELSIHRCNEWSTGTPNCMERLNLSAMAAPQYRLGIERGGTGQFDPLYFCFENVTPGVAYCPMRMTPSDGIQFNISKPGQAEQWVSASTMARR